MSGHKYITNSSDLFGDDDVDDETFLKNSRKANSPPEHSSYEDQLQSYEQRKANIENRTIESSQRSLGLLRETEQVGIATAEELAKQREQLENTSKQLDDINSTLRFSQKHLNGLKSVFGGLKNYLSGQKDMQPPLQGSGGKILDSSDNYINQDGLTSPTLSADDRYNSHPLARLRDDNVYQKEQAKAPSFNEQLDRNLDEMAGSLSRLKGLAIDLHGEIDQQNDLIDNITNKVDNVDVKIGRQNKEMNKLLGKK